MHGKEKDEINVPITKCMGLLYNIYIAKRGDGQRHRASIVSKPEMQRTNRLPHYIDSSRFKVQFDNGTAWSSPQQFFPHECPLRGVGMTWCDPAPNLQPVDRDREPETPAYPRHVLLPVQSIMHAT